MFDSYSGGYLQLVKSIKIMATVLLASAVAMLASEVKEPSAQVAAERPNFVFVMTDDLNERSMEQLGGIRDVMGSNGTSFDNAYVTYSLCCPSRASILRGQYPHNHGIVGNHQPLGGEPNFQEFGPGSVHSSHLAR